MKIWDKFSNFLFASKIISIIKQTYFNMKVAIINSYNRAKVGNEDMKIILVYWSVLPVIVYFLVRHKIILNGAIALVLDICFFLLFCLAYYFIAKAVEKHPEFDILKTKEMERLKYYETLTEEQLKEEKKRETKKEISNRIKRFIFLSNQDTIESFKVVRTLLLLFILVSLKRIIF